VRPDRLTRRRSRRGTARPDRPPEGSGVEHGCLSDSRRPLPRSTDSRTAEQRQRRNIGVKMLLAEWLTSMKLTVARGARREVPWIAGWQGTQNSSLPGSSSSWEAASWRSDSGPARPPLRGIARVGSAQRGRADREEANGASAALSSEPARPRDGCVTHDFSARSA